MIEVIDIDSSFPLRELLPFCNHAIMDPEPAARNIYETDWQTQSHTLMYLLYKNKVFDSKDKARYYIVKHNNEIVAGSGYRPVVNADIAVLGVRSYTIPSARTRMWHAEFILPRSLIEVKELGYKAAILTFNDYNLDLCKAIERCSKGKGGGLGFKAAAFAAYTGWTKVPFQVNINNTKQWVMYQCLSDNYEEEFLKLMANLRAA